MQLPIDVHDGAIVSYRQDSQGLEVLVTQYDGTLRTLRFEEVHAVHDLEAVEGYDPADPEGSLDFIDEAQYGTPLSAVRDLTVQDGGTLDEVKGLRQFDFTNTDSRPVLSVVARRVTILPRGETANGAPMYRLQTDVFHRLYCGKTRAGLQFILGHDGGENAILLEFDTAGRLLRTVDRIFEQPVKSIEGADWEFYGRFQDLQRRHPLGFELETVRIQEFHHEAFEIGVAARPLHFDDLERRIADASIEPEERERLEGTIREWAESRYHVLIWFNDCYVTESGLIVDG
jgi:hypothetical protein